VANFLVYADYFDAIIMNAVIVQMYGLSSVFSEFTMRDYHYVRVNVLNFILSSVLSI